VITSLIEFAAQFMRTSLTTILLFLLWSTCSANLQREQQSKQPATSPLTVTYIANEGVLISHGNKQVLIDGLFRKYKPDYLFPPQPVLESMEAARPPYNKIDVVLVSHPHLDHFHPESVGSFLKNNRDAVLVSSQQVAERLQKEFKDFKDIESRVKQDTAAWKMTIGRSEAGIVLTTLGLRHGGSQFVSIQNMGYIVVVDGKKLLHIGDADMSEENFASFALPGEAIDVAFIPYWFLLSEKGRALVRNHIQPKHIIAVHVPPAEADSVSEQLRNVAPDVIVFTKPMESRTFP
jgi:L-ascorbate metabolism protein UlaG (beta-lactamase superfamily)